MMIQRLDCLLNFQLVFIIIQVELAFLYLNFRDYLIGVASITIFREKNLVLTQVECFVLLFKKVGFYPVLGTCLRRFLVLGLG